MIFERISAVTREPAAIAAQQVRLLARYQPEGGFRALNPEDPLYWGVVAQLAAVRLDVMGRRAKFKLGQNRPAATRRRIIAEPHKRGRFPGQTLSADQAGAPTAAPVV